MTTRRATPDDARAIAAVHVRAWDIGYRGLVPDEVIDAQTVVKREGKWATVLAGDQPTLVAERDGAVAGFLSLILPSRDADADASTAELAALYVDPDHWRNGVATALLTSAVASLDERWTALTLWVLEANARAHGFYARAGFVPDGARGAWKGLPDVRLRRAVGPHA